MIVGIEEILPRLHWNEGLREQVREVLEPSERVTLVSGAAGSGKSCVAVAAAVGLALRTANFNTDAFGALFVRDFDYVHHLLEDAPIAHLDRNRMELAFDGLPCRLHVAVGPQEIRKWQSRNLAFAIFDPWDQVDPAFFKAITGALEDYGDRGRIRDARLGRRRIVTTYCPFVPKPLGAYVNIVEIKR